MRYVAITGLLAALAACGGQRTGAATCGLAQIAGPTLITQRLYDARALITDAPRGLPSDLPARVVGERQGRVALRYVQDQLALTYAGTGFPTDPGLGYALLVVDDTSARVQGVVIYNSEGPQHYPAIGYVTSGERSIALYGVRVSWANVSNPRCPLLSDTAAAARP